MKQSHTCAWRNIHQECDNKTQKPAESKSAKDAVQCAVTRNHKWEGDSSLHWGEYSVCLTSIELLFGSLNKLLECTYAFHLAQALQASWLLQGLLSTKQNVILKSQEEFILAGAIWCERDTSGFQWPPWEGHESSAKLISLLRHAWSGTLLPADCHNKSIKAQAMPSIHALN